MATSLFTSVFTLVLFSASNLVPAPFLAETAAAPEMEVSVSTAPVVAKTTVTQKKSSGTAPAVLKITLKATLQITAYSSSVDETDETPHITASGRGVHDGIVATNLYPFGTSIRIPSLYGDKIFVVEDRMNRRYTDRVDIWMPDKESALKFGKQIAEIEVLEF